MANSEAHPPKQFLELWENHVGPLPRGPFRSDGERVEAMILQEEALLDFAKQYPFSPEQLVALRRRREAQGQEHEVFLPVSKGSEARVWKVTRQIARGETRWGIKGDTPREYLVRLDRLDSASNTHILVEGIAIEHGAPLLVTSMDYVEGSHVSPAELDRLLRASGWERDDTDRDFLSYRLDPDGLRMRDAHAKNIIVTPAGKLVPIDVIFDGVVRIDARVDDASDEEPSTEEDDVASDEDSGA